MTCFMYIILCGIIITSSADLQCSSGETEDSCPADCDADSCPKNENYSRSCDRPKICPKPACKCRFNFSRASNGTCISTRDCPAFPCTRVNEEYVSCPSYCPTDDCSQATVDGKCPLFGHILVVVECRPACRCKKGYWRKNGVCVPYAKCPGKEQ